MALLLDTLVKVVKTNKKTLNFHEIMPKCPKVESSFQCLSLFVVEATKDVVLKCTFALPDGFPCVPDSFLHFKWGDGAAFRCRTMAHCFERDALVRANGTFRYARKVK